MKKISIILLSVYAMCILAGCGNQQADKKVMLKNVDSEEATINIKVAGDNMFHSNVLKYGKQEDGTYDFSYMYENIKDYIGSADIAVINQESAVVSDLKRVQGYPAFGVPDSICDTLIDVGFDVILQANNHVTDKEQSGVESTIAAWRSRPQVTYLGIHDTEEDARKIRFVQAKSVKIGMLNYTYGVNRETWPMPGQEHMVDMINEEKMQDDIARAKKLSDMVIVFLHDGTEYTHTPSEDQKSHINHCIDYGADIVVCAHPHVIQPYEAVTTPRGNNGLVYYSVGNFVSGQEKFATLLGGVADITLKKEPQADGKTKITITNYGLEPVVTHLDSKAKQVKVYKLRDYTNELASASNYGRKHKKYTVQDMWDLYNKVVNSEAVSEE